MTRTVNSPREKYSVSGKVARASDGSSYIETPDSRTGEIASILIVDVPGRRYISLDVRRKVYRILNNEADKGQFPVIGNILTGDALRSEIDSCNLIKPAHTDDAEISYLGLRKQDGFEECGRRTEYDRIPASSHFTQKIWEDWLIPALDITAQRTGYDEDGKPSDITKIRNIQTKEPDPHLFEIPSGYTRLPFPSSN